MITTEVNLFDPGTERIKECISQGKRRVKRENMLKVEDEAEERKFLYCTVEIGHPLKGVFFDVLVFDGQWY